MSNFFVKLIVKIRKITSPIIWKFVKPFLTKPEENMWDKIKEYPLNVFNALIKSQTYKLDPIWGILDYTAYDPSYFFSVSNDDKILWGRDCDDSAYITYLYLKEKNYIEECYMILGMNKNDLRTSHFWVVAKFNDGNYRLFNYGMYDVLFNSLEEACEEFEKEKLISCGKYEKCNWAIYDEFIKEE